MEGESRAIKRGSEHVRRGRLVLGSVLVVHALLGERHLCATGAPARRSPKDPPPA